MAITNLNIASDTYIKLALSSLKGRYNTSMSWIDPSNRYLPDPISKIRIDRNPPNNFIDTDITEYVATSVFIHIYNGWSYLSSALHSFLEGDFGNAIHNAYYAELRAIMSFLASQGIGVFNSNNVIIDNAGLAKIAQCTDGRENRTHSFAKLALTQWLNEPANSEKILKIISPEGVPLKNWIDATQFPPGSVLPAVLAKQWLAEWSFDMSVAQSDHDLRNVVSYQPQVFNTTHSQRIDSIKDRIFFLKDLWAVCSPMDLYNNSLLRFSLEYIYGKLGYNINQLDVEKDIKVLFQDVGVDGNNSKSSNLIKFLRREIEPQDNLVFLNAKNSIITPISEANIEPLGIISRACLFLLFSTKVADTLLKSSLTSKTELQFWLEYIGAKMGFWETGNEPTLFADLWEDVKLEMDELEKWSLNNSIPHNQYLFKKDLVSHTKYVKQINRTYLWNLTL